MRAIIIGAGPAGLVAALRFRTILAVDVVVYEIRPKLTTIGGAVQIPPNGLRLMDLLGLSEQLNASGYRSSRIVMHSMQGDVVSDIDRSQAGGDESGFGYMRILRKDLVEILNDAVREEGIDVRFGKILTKIEEDDEKVTVHFDDGSSDQGDLVLGCDGIHSAVRRLLVDSAAEPTYSGIANLFAIMSLGDLEMTSQDVSEGLHGTMSPQGLLAFSPCNAAADQLYWFFSRGVDIPDGQSREGWEAKGKEEVNAFKNNILDILQDATGNWNDHLREMVRATRTMHFYPIFRMPPSCKWSSKRCILLGDAAHAMPPHAGQGTSMALEDVFWLTRLLGNKESSLAEVFANHERIRRPRVESIAQAAAERGRERARVTPRDAHMAREVVLDTQTPAGRALNGSNYHNAIAYSIMEEPLPA